MKIVVPPGFDYPDLEVEPVGSQHEGAYSAGGFQYSVRALRRLAEHNDLDLEELKTRHIVPVIGALYRDYCSRHPGYTDGIGEFLVAMLESARSDRTTFIARGGRA